MADTFNAEAKPFENNDTVQDVKSKITKTTGWFESNWRKISIAIILIQFVVIAAQMSSIDTCEQHLKDAFVSSRSMGELFGFGPPSK
jgi:hypothetical protein